ncbi:MAG: LPXTG cell wall anchor domain-containing protein [Candidatus Binataceae bacterium]|nr:LPXTG cell wall anchor domain-containing protein [Candidatus Binataceae bacterium]
MFLTDQKKTLAPKTGEQGHFGIGPAGLAQVLLLALASAFFRRTRFLLSHVELFSH